MGVYNLPAKTESANAAPIVRSGLLSQELLVGHMQWFCRLRWIVAAVLLIFGVSANNPAVQNYWKLNPMGMWPFVVAFNLVFFNLFYGLLLRRHSTPFSAETNLWFQIILDLILLTVVVHFVGSTQTHIPFVYLFHIVLSSIFFTSRRSFMVLAASCLLFAVCLYSEYAGLLTSSGGIFDASVHPAQMDIQWLAVHYCSVTGIWAGVWYLAGHLSDTVRKQDIKLRITNHRLHAAIVERTRHMLWTTHSLKSPFAAIAANTQLLTSGACGTLPEKATEIAARITRRCSRLSREIQEMLQLANLDSDSQPDLKITPIHLREPIENAVRQIQSQAQRRGISIQCDLADVALAASKDHMVMLFENLISNAVNYSYDGGRVEIRLRQIGANHAEVSIVDHGIGIPADKIPRIFEEYYRTKEASAHCTESSGLGLAIVKHITHRYGIQLSVESRPKEGTQFTLRFAAECS